MKKLFVCLMMVQLVPVSYAGAEDVPCSVLFQGEKGPGKGKHIVLIAGDHEYRSEEVIPALGRILARHHGFTCSVFFTTDPKTGTLHPGNSHISGLEALKSADLMLVGLRFQDFADDQMQHIDDYLKAGRPVIGIRTSTHAFKIPPEKKFARYSFNYKGEEFKGGFGRQVLGETWAGHYGKNHAQSTLFLIQKNMRTHPVLRGVKDVWVQSGGYEANPMKGSSVLAMARVLNGMEPTAPPAEGKQLMPAAWVRTYMGDSGTPGRVFTTTHGASKDIQNQGFRRMMINACFWAVGLEDQVTPDLNIDFVGPYNPSAFRFNGYRKGVKPGDLAGWDSPIMPGGASVKSP